MAWSADRLMRRVIFREPTIPRQKPAPARPIRPEAIAPTQLILPRPVQTAPTRLIPRIAPTRKIASTPVMPPTQPIPPGPEPIAPIRTMRAAALVAQAPVALKAVSAAVATTAAPAAAVVPVATAEMAGVMAARAEATRLAKTSRADIANKGAPLSVTFPRNSFLTRRRSVLMGIRALALGEFAQGRKSV